MPFCQSFTKRGKFCRNMTDGGRYCRQHSKFGPIVRHANTKKTVSLEEFCEIPSKKFEHISTELVLPENKSLEDFHKDELVNAKPNLFMIQVLRFFLIVLIIVGVVRVFYV
jgi:hypothetical protein